MPYLASFTNAVVVDEFHLLGNKTRGPNLETILTSLKGKVRLILLSATASNPQDIASWLNAKLIESDIRAVPLNHEIIATLQPYKEINQIISNAISSGSQLLIFCGTAMPIST